MYYADMNLRPYEIGKDSADDVYSKNLVFEEKLQSPRSSFASDGSNRKSLEELEEMIVRPMKEIEGIDHKLEQLRVRIRTRVEHVNRVKNIASQPVPIPVPLPKAYAETEEQVLSEVPSESGDREIMDFAQWMNEGPFPKSPEKPGSPSSLSLKEHNETLRNQVNMLRRHLLGQAKRAQFYSKWDGKSDLEKLLQR